MHELLVGRNVQSVTAPPQVKIVFEVHADGPESSLAGGWSAPPRPWFCWASLSAYLFPAI